MAISRKEWEDIKRRHGYKCAICGESKERLTKDHIRPIPRGGTDTADNIQPLCRSCNARKSNRTQGEYDDGIDLGFRPRYYSSGAKLRTYQIKLSDEEYERVKHFAQREGRVDTDYMRCAVLRAADADEVREAGKMRHIVKWKNGEIEILEGCSIDDAMIKAGYFSEYSHMWPVHAVEFWAELGRF